MDQLTEAERNEVHIIETCKESDCGQQFEITVGEKNWLEQKGMTLPKRCKACRSRRKAMRERGEL